MLRNKYLSAVLLAASLSVGIWGCGPVTEKTTTPAPTLTEFNKTLTLQGKIIDATTGAAIGGADLKVYLIQGTTNRTPDKLITDTADNNVGEYAFSGIPVAVNASIAYKVVAINTGYQRFEGECLFDTAVGASTTIDTTYNWIGNIYLFPVGSPAGDVTIYVNNGAGKPVSGATVRLTQNINANTATNGTTGIPAGNSTFPGAIATTTLAATGGLVQSLSGTTGTDGKVTFAGSTLVLGGSYTANALPLTFDGQQLAATADVAAIIVGTTASSSYNTITMGTVDPANYLYAATASNSTAGTVTSTGVLTLTFNRAVIIDTAAGAVTGTLSGASGGVLASTAASLSADGLTLTITPTFTTAPTAKGASISYTLNNIIYIKDTQANSGRTLIGNAGNLTNVYGTVVSGVVQILSF